MSWRGGEIQRICASIRIRIAAEEMDDDDDDIPSVSDVVGRRDTNLFV